ncbi:MAG: AhpC/TSA family protein, partial [Gemmatimonadota bacterium]
MHDRKDRIEELGADVVFVAFDEPEALRSKLTEGIDLAFPLGFDPERVSYRRWGLQRAPWWKIWLDPKVWKTYAQLLASGQRLRGGGADPLQLGGDFVIAADGTVAYSRPQTRDDRPPV